MSITLNSTVTGGLVDEMQLRPRYPCNCLPGPRPRDRPPGPRVHFLSNDPETDDKDDDDFYSPTGSGSLTSQSIINNTSLQRNGPTINNVDIKAPPINNGALHGTTATAEHVDGMGTRRPPAITLQSGPTSNAT